jgi:YggT family protein
VYRRRRLPLCRRNATRLAAKTAEEPRTMIELLKYLLGFSVYLIQLYIYVIIASVILSWMIGFGVINAYNPFVRSLYEAVNAVTEPLLRPIRRALPDLGAVDISPIILLLACFFLQGFITDVAIPNLVKLR